MLQRADKVLLRLALAGWGVSAYLMAGETELIPRRLSLSGRQPEIWFHWQIWLLAGILMVAARDVFMDLHCSVCGARENLLLDRWLLTRNLLCGPCRHQEDAARAVAQAETEETVPPEYAELFKALEN